MALADATAFPYGLRVLVVDDDPIWLKILDKMLRKCSYEVATCGLASDALQILRERRNKFDIVISDVNMPGMDGFKLLELIGLEMDLPVIMMSIDGETSKVMKGVRHGACDYLVKPVRMRELRNIWQHVYMRKMLELKEIEGNDSCDDLQIFRNGVEGIDERGLFMKADSDTVRKREDMDKDSRYGATVKKARVVSSSQAVQRSQALFTETVHEDSSNDIHMDVNILEHIVNGSEEPRHLDFALLHSITENFSEKKKIGSGGCGIVYKGILRNGVVAVKRLHNSRTIKDKMFHREVISLISVKHPNIVRFLGYCSFTAEHAIPLGGKIIMADIRERLLCFEHIRNGSLDQHLSDELRGHEWQTRYQIITGICKGLHYLHEDKGIIHMDLKPGNILLDDLMVPKISDFGLSRLESDSWSTTTRLITQGYTSPEYISGNKVTSKSDIYSLGVIVIELVTGSRMKPNITKVIRRWNHRWIKSMKQSSLAYQKEKRCLESALSSLQDDPTGPDISDIIDDLKERDTKYGQTQIQSSLAYQQVKRCLELALRCMQHDPTDRPDISDIIDDLKEIDAKDGQTQIQINPCCLEGILGIEPLEIHIPFEDFQVSHSIELTNDTDDYIAFVTKPGHRYHTEPDRGVVSPRSKCSVTLAMQAKFKEVSNMHYTEVITVLSRRVENGSLTATDITAGDMFIDNEEGNVVDEVNVKVVFGTPELAEEEES